MTTTEPCAPPTPLTVPAAPGWITCSAEQDMYQPRLPSNLPGYEDLLAQNVQLDMV